MTSVKDISPFVFIYVMICTSVRKDVSHKSLSLLLLSLLIHFKYMNFCCMFLINKWCQIIQMHYNSNCYMSKV